MTDGQAAQLLVLLGLYSASYEHDPTMTVRELVDDIAETLPDRDIGPSRRKGLATFYRDYIVLREEAETAIHQCRIWR